MEKCPSAAYRPSATASLDPSDWEAVRRQGHRMLDDMLDYIEHIREQPVWRPIDPSVRQAFRQPLPVEPVSLEEVHGRFMREVLPYSVGNVHPGFMGWVHGGGTVQGMLAEMLAGGLNANLGGRDQAPLEVEKQIGLWMRYLFGFPETSGGLFVTGSSMANLIGVLLARTQALGIEARNHGLQATERRLVGYAASTAHGCVGKAFEMSGLGSHALRVVPVTGADEMDMEVLARMVEADRSSGASPFLIVGSAGTVNTGAIDPLVAIADFAKTNGLWFHVDGALGALGMLSPAIATSLRGIERADSIALDFHKWGQVPYDAGYILARRQSDQLETFAKPADYLARQSRGLSAGSPWPCDLGPDLSRGFRALKTWITLQCHGSKALGAAMEQSCSLAEYLKERVATNPELELMAPVRLNIVCLRYRCAESDRVNSEIVADLHESGIAAPSESRVKGQVVVRVAIVNHRTNAGDIDNLLKALLVFGRARATKSSPSGGRVQPMTENVSKDSSVPELLGMARILHMGFRGEPLGPLAESLIARASTNPSDANALVDLSTVVQVQGAKQLGVDTLNLALKIRRLYELPSAHASTVRLLAIMAPGDLMTNAPLPFLFEDSDVHLSMLYLVPGEPTPRELPPHDVAFVAIGDTRATHALLQQLANDIADWPRPVLISPALSFLTAREHAFQKLRCVAGVTIPPTVEASRDELQVLCQKKQLLHSLLPDSVWPLIVRPLDSHAGHGLEKVDDENELAAYLATEEDTRFYLSPFIDYRSHDGFFRKFRVVLVDGVPFAGHMAISEKWMIHYLNAGMTESEWKRQEECQFMERFEGDFAARHAAALRGIHDAFGMEYLVIDCAETPEGKLLVFELDPGAVVHSMDPKEMFPYKRAAMEKIFAAFREMLLRKKSLKD